MPSGLGLHPFFPEQHLARLSCLFQGRWQCDSKGLPSQFLALEKLGQFDGSTTMQDYDLDHVYTGLVNDISLRWDSKKYEVGFANSREIFGYVVYSPGKNDFFVLSQQLIYRM